MNALTYYRWWGWNESDFLSQRGKYTDSDYKIFNRGTWTRQIEYKEKRKGNKKVDDLSSSMPPRWPWSSYLWVWILLLVSESSIMIGPLWLLFCCQWFHLLTWHCFFCAASKALASEFCGTCASFSGTWLFLFKKWPPHDTMTSMTVWPLVMLPSGAAQRWFLLPYCWWCDGDKELAVHGTIRLVDSGLVYLGSVMADRAVGDAPLPKIVAPTSNCYPQRTPTGKVNEVFVYY